ncbi:hypothetical protein [Methylocapsa aurea]|uniref:hypothetical protein n=1 Tax=Methylocapsa aurea TaxID=663610 RepID=UPI000563C5ED|nr:hypothetical protein [Methylocapsa aurea]
MLKPASFKSTAANPPPALEQQPARSTIAGEDIEARLAAVLAEKAKAEGDVVSLAERRNALLVDGGSDVEIETVDLDLLRAKRAIERANIVALDLAEKIKPMRAARMESDWSEFYPTYLAAQEELRAALHLALKRQEELRRMIGAAEAKFPSRVIDYTAFPPQQLLDPWSVRCFDDDCARVIANEARRAKGEW